MRGISNAKTEMTNTKSSSKTEIPKSDFVGRHLIF
jgi:hypothetical protein